MSSPTSLAATARHDLVLDVENLVMRYRKGLFGRGHQALHGISLSVAPGSVFGLLGPNGAGKTSLVKVLLGLATSWTGRAEVFGRRAGHPESRWSVGYLPEAHRLPPYLTGRQVLELFGGLCGRKRSWLKQRIPALLDDVGMSDAADRKVKEYSKGMQQRIGLAQALIHEPRLVFLDEPTDGVDPVGRAAIRDVIQRLKDGGVSVFINSHLLMEVELMCDRIVVLDKGHILREGTVDELTPNTGLVRFHLGETKTDLVALVRPHVESATIEKGALACRMPPDRTDAVIDTLRNAGVSIRAVQPERLTLEASFIDMIVAQSRGGAA